jgi:hypothetical protein
MTAGWRHSFSRNININFQLVHADPFAEGNVNYSSSYSDPASACVSGFA